jgi:hypothetical protein
MAFVGWDVVNYRRCRPYTDGGSMLMLGNQLWGENVASTKIEPWREVFGVTSYQTLDMDGGDLQRDLDYPHEDLDQGWHTVMNIGTLEHCWDAHQAYSTAARMVRVGGYFIGHAPVRGFYQHGIHCTEARAISAFFIKNGFELCEEWQQDRGGENLIQWLIVRKQQHRTVLEKPKQIWVNGQDQGIG